MKTNQLIEMLSKDVEPVKPTRIKTTLALALVFGAVAAFCLMFATVGLRSDIKCSAPDRLDSAVGVSRSH